MRWTTGKRKNKYGAVRTGGYASRAESKRAQELKLLQHAGNIRELKEQVRYPLRVNGELVCSYVSDFVYYEGDQLVVEDVKGCKTRVYQIKKKLFMALYPEILFREVLAEDYH